MKKLNLNGKWDAKCIFEDGKTLEFVGTVPGSTVGDLINSGNLPSNIFWRDNADEVVKYETCNYVYERKFTYTGMVKGTFLNFERLDTYCDVYLNGVHLGHRENGNISHTFSIDGVLIEGENTVTVKFYSPINAVKNCPEREGAFTTERINTRRMQCTYGWDWVARFISCSIRNCTLVCEEENELIVDNAYIVTVDSDSESATVRVDLNFKNEFTGRKITLNIEDDDGNTVCSVKKYCKEMLVRTDFDIPTPKLWYPIGYGKQTLYTFILSDGDKEIYREKFGIRTVKIMQLPDQKGSPYYEKCLSVKNKNYDFNDSFSGFILKVNGIKIMCKGANWVPCEPFETENTDAKQTEILELAAEMGVNMIRVWGGGAFEKPHFYNECSRLGIMVTQDFLMACGIYPENEDWFIEELNKEALYGSLLIRNQPCLMWWTGDNENAVDGCDEDENYSGRRSAYEGIAPILYKTDPYRRFLPSSPFGGKKYASNTVGTTHNSQYLGDEIFPYLLNSDMKDYKEFFKNFRARFIVEEPQGGSISLYSLRRFMTDADIFGEDTEMWSYHTKSNPPLPASCLTYMMTFAEKVLGKFKDGYERAFKYRYSQCEWIRLQFEQARREKGFCNGLIFWMLNDCWAASSGWAMIDYYCRPKPAYYSFKRCAKKVVTSIDKENGKFLVYVVNDGLCDEKINYTVKIVAKDGVTVKEIAKGESVAAAEKSVVIKTLDADLSDGEVMVADIEYADGKDRAFYKNGSLDICPSNVKFEVNTEKMTITLSSDKYIQAVIIEGYAILEDNCFTLMPNETKTVRFRLEEGYENPEFMVEAYKIEK